MKTVWPVVLALVLAPAAHAQGDCGALTRIVAAAPEAFAPVRGNATEEDFYTVTAGLPGADGCEIDLSVEEMSFLNCSWTHDARAAADARFAQVAANARACLPDWKEEKLPDNAPASAAFYGLIGVGEHARTFITLTIDQADDEHVVKLEVTR